jgi:hypothetical protein
VKFLRKKQLLTCKINGSVGQGYLEELLGAYGVIVGLPMVWQP